jgi:mono/diheme cytochrome c family protein
VENPRKTDYAHGLRRLGPVGLLLIASAALFSSAPPVRSDSSITPTPMIDRLATPNIPANPTPFDLGRQVYYLHCMPCHGDVGQGLTDEWRDVWVEDHRNCWGKGCHGGRADDDGFPIPKTIPAVIGPDADLAKHATVAEFTAYLERTHPPQRPGKLEKQEYEEVTAFLWHENQREPATATVQAVPIVIAVGGLLLAAIVLWLLCRTLRMRNRHEA